MLENKPLYLKGLNGIRAIAAILVIISHILRVQNPVLLSLNLDRYNKMGGAGVSVFFALSGFLITYLLLLEKQKSNISIKKFYVRRILRIWPLYYLYLAITLAIIFLHIYKGPTPPESHFIPYYIFFCSNLLFHVGLGGETLVHYWSLAAEEQFYLFWPHIIKKITIKRMLYGLIIFLSVFVLAKLACHLLKEKFAAVHYLDFIWKSQFDCMTIGAIGACVLFFNHLAVLKIIQSKYCQITSWLLLALFAFSRFTVSIFLHSDLIAVCATFIILAQVTEKARVFNLEKPALNYLGKISYGLYVIHPIVIWALTTAVLRLPFNNVIIFYITLFSGTLAITVALAHLCYNYYEKPFLRLKSKYTVVKSTASAKGQKVDTPVLIPTKL